MLTLQYYWWHIVCPGDTVLSLCDINCIGISISTWLVSEEVESLHVMYAQHSYILPYIFHIYDYCKLFILSYLLSI